MCYFLLIICSLLLASVVWFLFFHHLRCCFWKKFLANRKEWQRKRRERGKRRRSKNNNSHSVRSAHMLQTGKMDVSLFCTFVFGEIFKNMEYHVRCSRSHSHCPPAELSAPSSSESNKLRIRPKMNETTTTKKSTHISINNTNTAQMYKFRCHLCIVSRIVFGRATTTKKYTQLKNRINCIWFACCLNSAIFLILIQNRT